MTAIGDTPDGRIDSHDEYALVELEYLLDDPEDPRELTIVATDADVTTHWITIDVESARSLEAMR
jgi:hypothetical protein